MRLASLQLKQNTGSEPRLPDRTDDQDERARSSLPRGLVVTTKRGDFVLRNW